MHYIYVRQSQDLEEIQPTKYASGILFRIFVRPNTNVIICRPNVINL